MLLEQETGASAVTITLTSQADDAVRKAISGLLDEYNVEQTGMADNQPLDVLVADAHSQRHVGGLVGRTSLGVFFINYFYLPASLRGQGIGARILGMAETEARRRGCREALLFTMTIQAPAFYQKHGYREFGRIDCLPEGNARLFMRKTLG